MSKAHRRPIWHTASELPEDALAAWHKLGRVISPVAIVATVNPDGTPRTAPFGSLRAVTPRLLQLCSHHSHDTYANLCRDGRVSVALITPDVAVSIRGRAQVVRERMKHDENFAALEIAIEEVKNDMAYRVIIDSGIR
jgi:flavin reductase (DIM6/NTAB) family NADH-FMN oxidoreductase RutF